MSGRDPRYVSSSRPINRRTADKPKPRPAATHPLVQQRMRAARAQRRLGPSFEELQRRRHAPLEPTRPTVILGSIVATGGAVALFLGWLQASPALSLVGIAGLIPAAAAILWARRKGDSSADKPEFTPLFEPAQLRALDTVMEQMATEISDEIARRLKTLKQLLVRMERHAATLAADENFTLEDRMYVIECVRRYLPDSLQSYLMVPAEQRATAVLEGDQSANSLLLGQLSLLESELEARMARLAASAGEPLLKQQRFLSAKTRLR